MVKTKIIFFVFLCPLFSFAFQLDWSGKYRVDGIYLHDWDKKAPENFQHPLKYLIYTRQVLRLGTKAYISDGLLFQLKTNLYVPSFDFNKSILDHSRDHDGVVSLRPGHPALIPTHFYGTYIGEFFKLDFGRQPFHFGLGMTYSEGDGLTDIVYDVRDGLSLEVRKDAFYVKPYALVLPNNYGLDGALQAGYRTDSLKLEFLYNTFLIKAKRFQPPSAEGSENPFERVVHLNSEFLNQNPFYPRNTINAYGFYKILDSLQLSAEWGSSLNGSQIHSMSAVGELHWKTPFYNSSVALQGGAVGLNNTYTLNPNYNPSFLLWDYYYLKSGQSNTGLTNCYFMTFNPSASLGDYFNLSAAYTWLSGGHDFFVGFKYKNKGFVWDNKIGAGLLDKNTRFIGALTRLAVSF